MTFLLRTPMGKIIVEASHVENREVPGVGLQVVISTRTGDSFTVSPSTVEKINLPQNLSFPDHDAALAV